MSNSEFTMRELQRQIDTRRQAERMGFETNKRIARDFNNRRETCEIGGKACNFRSQVLRPDGTWFHIEAKGHPDARARRKLKLLNKYRPEVEIWMVFQSKRDAAKLGLSGRKYCKRVCLLRELTRDII